MILIKVLDLLKGSNSVELKIMVPDTHRGAIKALGFDPVQAEPRQTYFFDTPDLSLNKAGLIVRARRSPGDRGDTVVKLAPVDPALLEADLRRDEAFKIEVDVNPGGYVCSASAKGRCTAQEVLDVSDGKIAAAIDIFPQAARLFHSSCAGRSHDEAACSARSDISPSPQAATEGLRQAGRCRALALSGRVTHF